MPLLREQDTGLELASGARVRPDSLVLLSLGALRSPQIRSNCYQDCYQAGGASDLQEARVSPSRRLHGRVDGACEYNSRTVSAHPANNNVQTCLELPVAELLLRARPLPDHDEMVIEDLTVEEGEAFLAEIGS